MAGAEEQIKNLRHEKYGAKHLKRDKEVEREREIKEKYNQRQIERQREIKSEKKKQAKRREELNPGKTGRDTHLTLKVLGWGQAESSNTLKKLHLDANIIVGEGNLHHTEYFSGGFWGR